MSTLGQTDTTANVASSAVSVNIFAAETSGIARLVFNGSTAVLSLKFRVHRVGDELHGADRGGRVLRVPAAPDTETCGLRPTTQRPSCLVEAVLTLRAWLSRIGL